MNAFSEIIDRDDDRLAPANTAVGTPQAITSTTPVDAAALQSKRDCAGRLARWTETHARSLAKAVSWRATGSLDTFIVAFVITGSTKLAGSVAVAEILTKILIYYLHERIWAWVPWGKR
jgi:uncharacterized membrane protein